MKKVFYNSGNNIDNNYFIVGQKEKSTVEEESLVNKLTGSLEIEILDVEIDGKRFSSSQDFLIQEVEIKTGNIKKYIFCDKTEIQF